jgi:hypothetical protein
LSLLDRQRAGRSFLLDPEVRRCLAEFGRAPDRARAAEGLRAAAAKLDPQRRAQLMDKLAELAVAQLAVFENSRTRNVAPSSGED